MAWVRYSVEIPARWIAVLVLLGPVGPIVAVSALLAIYAVDSFRILAMSSPMCPLAANFVSKGAAC